MNHLAQIPKGALTYRTEGGGGRSWDDSPNDSYQVPNPMDIMTLATIVEQHLDAHTAIGRAAALNASPSGKSARFFVTVSLIKQ